MSLDTEKLASAVTAFEGAAGTIHKIKEDQHEMAERLHALEQKGTIAPGLDADTMRMDKESGIVRDTEGRRIGVHLKAADLRDPAKIRTKLGTKAAPGMDGEVLTLGGFFRGVANMKRNDVVTKALAEGTDSTGGYAVPTNLLPGILAALAPASSLLQAGAGITQLDSSNAKTFNVAGIDTLPTAAWRLENGALSESGPTFRNIAVTPQDLAFVIRVSRELLADAPGMDQALQTAIGQAFAKELDRAGLLGTGTAPEIRGLLNISGVNAVSTGTNGAALADYKPFTAARRAILDANASAPTAAIIATRDDQTIADFVDTTGQPLRRPDALANWQFIATSQVPVNDTVGTSNDCSAAFVGDFSGFVYFMRERVNVQMLTERYADVGQIGFAVHARVDVAALYPKGFAIVSGLRPAP